MRAFVRFLAFSAVFACGLLAVGRGYVCLLSDPPPATAEEGPFQLSVLMGLALMVAATILIAVRPKVRQSPARPAQAASVDAPTTPSPTNKATASGADQEPPSARPAQAASADTAATQSPTNRATASGAGQKPPPKAPTVTLDLGPQGAPKSVSATFHTRGTGPDGAWLLRCVSGVHWRLIEPGWTEGQVRRLLGGPRRIEPRPLPTGAVMTVWHYGKWPEKYRGRVEFLEGKVLGFDAPPSYTADWVYPGPETS